MSEPFLAEVRIVGFNFAPRGWAFCDGQILPINQNQSLYSLLGTTYGGDGRTSFALPDLRGRTPIHVGRSNGGDDHREGQKGGEETHTLSANEMPNHSHAPNALSDEADSGDPTGRLLSDPPLSVGQVYSSTSATMNVQMSSLMVANVGGSQAHENMQPYLALNYCIALQGLFPSRN
jgi:microcystin-dependent protein